MNRVELFKTLRSQVRKEITANKNSDWKEAVDFVSEVYGELPSGIYACLLQQFNPERIKERKMRYSYAPT